MPQLGVARLAMEVLGESVGLGRAIVILFVLVVDSAVEVRGTFMLIWPTMLYHREISHCAFKVARNAKPQLARTYVYLVMSSRMSHDEYS